MVTADYHSIAVKCPEYEAITEVQNFGISFLTNLEALTYPRCDWCLNWYDANCHIFQEATPNP